MLLGEISISFINISGWIINALFLAFMLGTVAKTLPQIKKTRFNKIHSSNLSNRAAQLMHQSRQRSKLEALAHSSQLDTATLTRIIYAHVNSSPETYPATGAELQAYADVFFSFVEVYNINDDLVRTIRPQRAN